MGVVFMARWKLAIYGFENRFLLVFQVLSLVVNSAMFSRFREQKFRRITAKRKGINVGQAAIFYLKLCLDTCKTFARLAALRPQLPSPPPNQFFRTITVARGLTARKTKSR